ncbi:MAG: patatin-like phospholipase family protein [Luteolibacter sp.]
MFTLSKLAFWKRTSPDTRSGRPMGDHPAWKPRLGLALSSGGARGLAHVGVLEVLEEAGIEIHAIAGSSMGAYVGALWAAGFSGKQLEDLAAEMNDSRQMWKLADPLIPPLKGLFKGEKAKKHLSRSVGDLKIEDLERRLMIITFDLDTCERLVVRSGSLADAVHASCAMPGVVAPVSFKGRRCADGGVVDPVPVGALRRFGDVDRVIAVSTLPSLAEVEAGCCRPEEEANPSWWRRGTEAFSRHTNPLAPGNIGDTFRKSIRAAQIRLADDACRRADLCLHPPYVAARWHEYSRFEHFIEAGRRIAREHLDEIRALAGMPNPEIQPHEPTKDNLVVGERVA